MSAPVPALLTIATSAILAGRSPLAIRDLIYDGDLAGVSRGRRYLVDRHSLEHFLGRPITADLYLAAQARQEPVRAAARARRYEEATA